MSYTHPPRGDVKRLPKWAQEYITDLQREIDSQESHIKEISSEHPGSNVVLDSHHTRPAMTLPPGSAIRFHLGESRDDLNNIIEVHHQRRDNNAIEVYAYGGRLAIFPHSSNTAALRIDNR